MRTRGVVVALFAAATGCFSTARYDREHQQRVVDINARYDEQSRRERERYGTLARELDIFQSLLIPVRPESAYDPVSRVDERDDIVECRRSCDEHAPGEAAGRQAHEGAAAQCIRAICQPVYAAALIRTYHGADVSWVADQLTPSTSAELESLLAFSHNQAVLALIDAHHKALTEHQAHAHGQLEGHRQQEIRASLQQREAAIATGEAARRDRVKAAAAAFADEDRIPPSSSPHLPAAAGRGATPPAAAMPAAGTRAVVAPETPPPLVSPTAPATRGVTSAPRARATSAGRAATAPPVPPATRGATVSGDGAADSPDAPRCAGDAGCEAAAPAAPRVCAPVGRDGIPAFEPTHHLISEPTLSIGCKIQLDCPAGFRCDFTSGACMRSS
jgi:hypothetical protein